MTMKIPSNPEDYREYATDRQYDVLVKVCELRSYRGAARQLGLHHKTVRTHVEAVLTKAAARGFAPENDMVRTVPAPFVVGGVSTLYDSDGEIKQQWIKSKLDKAILDGMLEEYTDAYFAALPKIETPEFAYGNYDTDVIPWYQIGDAHIGMLAHAVETDSNFDLKIAVTELMGAFKILFEDTKPGERCVINDLGDATHYENFSGTTEASGHALDYDGRFNKMISAYIPLMRFIVDAALEKFKFVDIIINQGNHSRTNDVWMAQLLHHVYSSTNRVHVLDNSNIFIPYRMGNTFVMTHHSDKCRHDKLAKVMATDYAQDWGESTFRYIDTGHVHHGFTSKEHPGVLIESWNNLASRDKYAHEGGWRSKQSITRVDRSRRYGNIGRRTLSVEEIRDRIRAGLIDKVDGYKLPDKKEVYKV